MIDRPVLPQPQNRPFGRPSNLPVLARQGLLVVFVLLCIGVMTFALYLYVLPNSQMSEAQARIASLRAQVAVLDRETAENFRRAAEFTNLPVLEARAKKLGMGPPRKILYMPQPALPDSTPGHAAVMAPSNAAKAASPGLPQGIESLVEQVVSRLRPSGGSR